MSRMLTAQNADEIAFLNICSFREEPIGNLPMLEVLEAASERVFVPLTIGGGIRAYTDRDGQHWSALDVASRYFRSGADKVSIGSDAVYAAEKYYQQGGVCDGSSAIEQISKVYGKQAVVISLDPKRAVADPVTRDGKRYWYQATVKGGRECRPIDVVRVAVACEALGAGELLVNSVDADGQKNGYDLALISAIKQAVSIPVIASSGAGVVEHFSDVFLCVLRRE